VLLAVGEAIGKGPLDVLVDRWKSWLANRPDEDRKVRIDGANKEVVLIVKKGKEIRTSSKE
jgi:hypothetical protein